jgi:BioD-like phosphotransacetylase family protein
MKAVVVTSTAPYSGKSGVCVALIGILQERGLDVGYFKPYGTLPSTGTSGDTDLDAVYINELLKRPVPADSVCAVVRTRTFVEDVLADRIDSRADVVADAYARAAAGRDVMVVEGPSDAAQGTAVGLSMCEVVELLDAKAVVVEKGSVLALPDALLHVAECLGDRMAGVVYNGVREHDRPPLLDHTRPFLERRGVRFFGTIAHDPILSSVTVGEIVESLGAAVLCAEDKMDLDVESFMVGAMGQDKALRFFRRKANKAVITGGDRADVQLAALETSTNLLILTGNMPPSAQVLARADEMGVPMVMVDVDTLTAVERMESLVGHVRLHGAGKADRMREMFAEGVRVEEMLDALGLSSLEPRGTP